MRLYDELYFEITLRGEKAELKNYVKYLKSGELDDFFEMSNDFICYDDSFASSPDDAQTEIVFTNDDIGVEIDRIQPEDLADVICRAAKRLDVIGHLYDADGEEFNFESPLGDNSFIDSRKARRFNDELDDAAEREEEDEE